MKTSTTQCLLALALGLGLSTGALADEGGGKTCSNATLHGRYGIQMQGTNVTPGGVAQNVIGVVNRYYDGKGGLWQLDSIKGTASGIVPNRYGVGTYEVSDDCSVVLTFQPVPGFFIEERGVIVDNGFEVRTITVTPPTTMVTATHIKM